MLSSYPTPTRIDSSRSPRRIWANGHHGAIRVGIEASIHAGFEEAMDSAVQDDVEFQTIFLESHPETPTVYSEFNWTTAKLRFSGFSYTQYDAVTCRGLRERTQTLSECIYIFAVIEVTADSSPWR